MPVSTIAGGTGVGQLQKRLPGGGRGKRLQLTEKQRLFIREYVSQSGNRSAAAKSAGISRASADYYLGVPHVIDEIYRMRDAWLRTDLAQQAGAVLAGLLNSETTPAMVRYQAARYVLEMAGHEKPQQNQALNNDKPLTEMTIEELQTFINAGTGALKDLKNQRLKTIDGDVVRTADSPGSAQDDAQVPDDDDWMA